MIMTDDDGNLTEMIYAKSAWMISRPCKLDSMRSR
jgi:hypothetical protein